MPVYDPEKEYDPSKSSLDEDSRVNLDNLSSDQLENLEQKYSSDQDEAEDKAIEQGADPEEAERLGMSRKLREHANKNDPANSFFKNEEADKHNASIGGLKGKLTNLASKKVLMGGIGAGLAAAFIVIGSFLGFLNVFKLEHIMNNIETRAFSRYQVAMDGRSDRWIRAYMMTRLGEIANSTETDVTKNNLFFKADRVATGHPLTDWYKTLRTSSFEKSLLKDNGIHFTSIAESKGDYIEFRSGRIDISGADGINIDMNDFNAEARTILGKDNFKLEEILNNPAAKAKMMEKYNIEFKKFDNNKTARKAIKKAVYDKSRPWQVIKRRHMRKWIQNKVGVRSWRFFDKTRTKAEEKVISTRNKIIKAMLPDNTVMGRIVQCIFGAATCRASTDTNNPDNNGKGDPVTDNQKINEDEPVPDGDNNSSNDKTLGEALKEGDFGADNTADEVLEAIQDPEIPLGEGELKVVKFAKVLAKAMPYIGLVSGIETLNAINTAFQNHSMTKMITVARGTQAMGAYTTFMTAKDQLKTGEVTMEEVNELMQTVNAVSNSEGWTSAINASGSGNTAEAEEEIKYATNREEYCSEAHQEAILLNPRAYENEFHYLCDDKRIGGDNNANTIEGWWNGSIGKALGPFFTAYNNDWNPLKWVGKAVLYVGDVVGEKLMEAVKYMLPASAEQSIGEVFAWVIAKIATGLGAGPMMDGNEPSGVYMNMVVQGAAYTAESSARSSGAAITNTSSKALSNNMVAAYYNDYYEDQGMFDRYLALNNPYSSLSQSLFASVENNAVNDVVGVFGKIVTNIAKSPLNIFSRGVSAGVESPYAAANFAGIETYDFPQECYDLDPMTMEPQDVTNADDNGIIPANELTWDLVNNNDAFNELLFSNLYKMKGEDADVDADSKLIYNCAALDTTVRGGLGYVYGYTDDYGGINDSSSEGNDTAAGSIVKNALDFAWQDKKTGGDARKTKATATTTYQTAAPQFNPTEFTDGSGNPVGDSSKNNPWTDCGKFVATAILASGVDPNYPAGYTRSQENYLDSFRNKENAPWYVFTMPRLGSDSSRASEYLQPGDILVYTRIKDDGSHQGHTMIYVGDFTGSDGKTYNVVEARLDETVPQAQTFKDPPHAGVQWTVARKL